LFSISRDHKKASTATPGRRGVLIKCRKDSNGIRRAGRYGGVMGPRLKAAVRALPQAQVRAYVEMMKVAILGAGMAGLACAEALRGAKLEVTLFDKGRAAGGRMSTRRLATIAGEASFDYGAQYFTARDPAFRALVEQWRESGIAAPWPAAGDDAWVGTPGMNAPVKQLAEAARVHWSAQIDKLSRDGDGWRIANQGYDIAVVATPAEQAQPLLEPWAAAFAAKAAESRSAPCWTVMAAFAEPLPFAADVLREQGPIGWAARNSAKPGRSGPESWVVQAGPDWSRQHLEEAPAGIVAPILDALAERAGQPLPTPLIAAAHRWRFAKSGSAGNALLWSASLRLGVCGDWLIGPRVEAAWLSGHKLATALLASLG
jgi:predicted NAD/FAD-dependent oxidoreductase